MKIRFFINSEILVFKITIHAVFNDIISIITDFRMSYLLNELMQMYRNGLFISSGM